MYITHRRLFLCVQDTAFTTTLPQIRIYHHSAHQAISGDDLNTFFMEICYTSLPGSWKGLIKLLMINLSFMLVQSTELTY